LDTWLRENEGVVAEVAEGVTAIIARVGLIAAAAGDREVAAADDDRTVPPATARNGTIMTFPKTASPCR
jgi:hypothetical protein